APNNTSLEKWFAINITGYRQSEVLQYGWRDVDDFRHAASDRAGGQCPARDQDARRRFVVVRSVVAGPFLPVRIDDARRRAAERGLPRDAVAVREADLELRRVVEVRPGIDVLAFVHRVDDPLAGFRIGHGHQTRGEVGFDGVRVSARGHDAVSLAAFEIEIHLAESHGVRLGPRPVDVFPERAAAEQVFQFLLARRLAFNGHEALL